MTLVPVDPTNALAVSDYLTKARDWLATAVERTGPSDIAAAKAEIATAAEATKQLGLSKEIQLDAKEMVRRAEFALGKAIRKGQAEGTVARREDNQWTQPVGDNDSLDAKSRPTDFATRTELWGSGTGSGIYELANLESERFDAAIDAAKAEGNLSRANVVRKAAEKAGRPVAPASAGTTERAHQEAELINSFGSIVRRSLTPKNVATLTPTARERLIHILETALNTLKETPA